MLFPTKKLCKSRKENSSTHNIIYINHILLYIYISQLSNKLLLHRCFDVQVSVTNCPYLHIFISEVSTFFHHHTCVDSNEMLCNQLTMLACELHMCQVLDSDIQILCYITTI